MNSGPPTAKGIEALSLPENKGLAKALAQAVAQVTGSPLRGDQGWKDQSKAGPHSRLGFCIHGGVILELAFITNKKELETYLAREAEVADAVANVVELFAMKGA
jgi:N-acetylmuramoyl-L-alanine amidase